MTHLYKTSLFQTDKDMKFSVNSALLSQRLQTLGRVVSSKNSMPILGNFYFKLSDNVLTIIASDNEVYLSTNIELVSSEGELEFTINAKTAQDSIKEIPEQPLDFNIDGDTLEITVNYQNGTFSLMGESADQYPLAKPFVEEFPTIVIGNDTLQRSINRALFATNNDILRPVMSGVYFDYKPEGLNIVASDGRKLACTHLLDIHSETPCNFILPPKPASIYKTLLLKEEGDTVIKFNATNAMFQCANYTMTCLLIAGRFPKYETVIPQNNPHVMGINRQALISALRRILVFSNVSTPLVKFRIEPGRLEISTRDTDYRRSGAETILCDFNGSFLEMGFRGTLLNDMLNNMDNEELLFKMADPSRASIVVPAQNNEGEEVVMLVMPMMISD